MRIKDEKRQRNELLFKDVKVASKIETGLQMVKQKTIKLEMGDLGEESFTQ